MVEKESIKVVIRTRPTPDFASKNINIDQNTQVSTFIQHLKENHCYNFKLLCCQTVTLSMAKDGNQGLVNNQKEQWTFKFDKIMHNASQEEVFEYCAQQAVHKVVDGFNGTIMCYG